MEPITDTPLTREEVARTIVRAASPDELAEARALREAYLQRHPHDEEIRALDELLDSLADVLRPKETQTASTNTRK